MALHTFWFFMCVIMLARDVAPEELALNAINEQRRPAVALGCAEPLRSVAETRAREIAAPGQFAHQPPGATEMRMITLARERGIIAHWMGETLAHTATPDAGHLIDLWIGSETHRAVLLAGEWSQACVGYYDNGDGYWWAAVFAS